MKIALLSPKGPLYRNRGGIFKKSLRYQPLTLTTLAALAPPELAVEFALYDEGIGDVPLDLDADLVGITVITGSSPRGYDARRPLPRPRHRGGAGRAACHLAARGGDAARRCDLRRLCRGDLAAAPPRLRRRSDAAALRPRPRFRIDQPAVSAPRPARREAFPDASGVRGDARLRARLRVLRGADRLGPQAVPEAGRPRGRGHPAGRQAPHHLHRPQPDLRPRLCDGAVRGAGAAEGALVRPRHQPDRPRRRADAADGEAAAAAAC